MQHPEVLGIFLYLITFFDNENSNEGEKVNIISDHVPVHKKPINDEEFGSYLAGLIEGDGYISNKIIQVNISFHLLDAPLAYYIKSRIGYGTVAKVKNKNAYNYTANLNGSIVIAKLITGKLRTDKINKFNCLLELINKRIPNKIVLKEKDTSSLTNSYWLAGFSDADSSFQVKNLKRPNRKLGYEIRLNYQLDKKNKFILEQIKEVFGGSIGHRKAQNTYYYGSVSFGSAKKVINYFDHYHLLSSKHINFLKWRKVYRLVQEKKHLTKNGIYKILKIKANMNNLSKDVFELDQAS